MKKWITFIWLGLALTAHANHIDSLLVEADSAYRAEDYSGAYEMWTNVQHSETLNSASLDYNLGNAAWKSGELGEAIWHWNRALKQDPGLEDARVNLSFTEGELVDRIVPLTPSPLTEAWNRIWSALSPAQWGTLGVVLFLFMAGSMLIFKYRKRDALKVFLPISWAFLFLGVMSTSFGIYHQNKLKNNLHAVVLNANIYVKSAPMIKGADAFILHEGTEMQVVKSAGEWMEIKLADGKVGWVHQDWVGVY